MNEPSRLPTSRGELPSAVKAPQRAAIIGIAAAAVTSLALMFRAGQRQRSAILVLLFAAWVVSPFCGLLYAHLRSKEWLRPARAALYAVTVLIAFGCPAVYAGLAFWRPTLKAGSVFLVVPFACWLLIGFSVCIWWVLSHKSRGRTVRGAERN